MNRIAASLTTTIMLALGMATPDAAADSTLIRGARIFDGERIIDATDVLIEGGRIAEVGRDLSAPPGAEVFDAEGRFLMPGLIDCHTHTFDASMLEQSLIFGVTTNLDMFTAVSALNAMRSSAGSTQADIFSAGTLVTAPGGHGTQYGIPIPTLSSPDEAAAFVNDRIDEGSDFIKIVYDDGSELGMSIPTVSPETLEAVIAAAHDRGMLAVVHIHAYEHACRTVERDADGLVHTFIDKLPDDRLAELMVEHGSFIIPTLSVIESVCGVRGGATLVDDESLDPYIDRSMKAALSNTFAMPAAGPKRDYSVAKSSVTQLHEAGVPILAGSDTPNPGTAHGASIHRELFLLVDAGLEPVEALRAATTVPADRFKLRDRGRIEPGRNADLVLVDGDPVKNITDTRRIAAVWKSGVKVDRDIWKNRVEAEREQTQTPAVARGLISDFEGEEISASFGSGWSVSTDAMMGGKSTAEMKHIAGGANGSAGALRVEGAIAEGSPYPWAGAMFCPGTIVFQPENLSGNDGFSFSARGDGGTYRVLIFDQSLGRTPQEKTFQTSGEWSHHAFKWSDFRTDGSGVNAIIFSAGTGQESFWFEIDDVRLTSQEQEPKEEETAMTDWVEAGQTAPAFTLAADDGSKVKLADFKGKPVVLYFYPKDDTPGCTKEACAFRDLKSDMESRGAVVLGVSPDSAESHRAFKEKYTLNFTLLADEGHTVAEKYGAWRQINRYGRTFDGIQRSTFLIGPDGKVYKTWKSVQVDGHDQKVLEALDEMLKK